MAQTCWQYRLAGPQGAGPGPTKSRSGRPQHGPAVLFVLVAILAGCSVEQKTLPAFYQWGKIELIVKGQTMKGMGEPNPFAIAFDVMFTGPAGSNFLVPGFYDGDGNGGLDGNVWKVRFSAPLIGAWRWHTQSPEPSLNGLRGQISVMNAPVHVADLYRLGRLEYVGERYLKFRDGGYWIKAGADEPENILGDAFGRDNWDAKKQQLDYLALTGVNSIYVMTHNIDGDRQDTWPWVGATQEEAKANSDRFDVAKLEHWRTLFEHAQSRGLVIHLVLEDDSAWTGFDYTRYYREMVARFGYLPALCFNFAEEHNEKHSLGEALDMVSVLKTIDPFNHPRAIHNVNLPAETYVNHPAISLSSIQTQPSKPQTLNQLAVDWFEAPLALRQRPLVVSFDEARPAGDRASWWAVYMGGGNWESLLPVERDFKEFDREWRQLALARQFMESLPVEKMFPANYLVTGGGAFCLARPGEMYALYLPAGGEVEVALTPGNRYRMRWFNPRAVAGQPWREETETQGGPQLLTAPDTDDWAVTIEKVDGAAVAPPTAASAKLSSLRNAPAEVFLAALPRETQGVTYEIVQAPKAGSLTGEPPELVYTPRPGFTGEDQFRWRARSKAGESNTAVVRITCNPSGENRPPRAFGQSVTVRAGEAETFSLRYTDRDGPGPYRINVTTPPQHGKISGLDNDITYTPAEGFAGSDMMEWRVHDGAARSNVARVAITVQ